MIAITGYSGFVGQHLLKELSVDNCLLMGRVKPLTNCQFCHFDLSSNQQDCLIDSLRKVSTLVHLGARVHVMNDESANPISEFRSINTKGTINLAHQAAKAGVKRFIFLSSIKVNGESTSGKAPFTARVNSATEDPYGISKAEAEHQLLELGNKTGMEIVIIRPPLVYGEGVKANFASLMRFVDKGLPLPFRGLKNNKRSLVSVYNLVDLIKVCIKHPEAANQVFLASDDHDLSTAEMVALMAKVQGKKNLALPLPEWCFKIVGKLLNKNDVIDRLTGSLQLDITQTKNTLDWAPPYSVEHGFELAAKKSSIK